MMIDERAIKDAIKFIEGMPPIGLKEIQILVSEFIPKNKTLIYVPNQECADYLNKVFSDDCNFERRQNANT